MVNDNAVTDAILAKACPAGDTNTVALVAASELPTIGMMPTPAMQPLMNAYRNGGVDAVVSKVCADHGQSFSHADVPTPSATPGKSVGANQR